MTRKCINCSTLIRHALVVDERDYCGKLCVCKMAHGPTKGGGQPKKKSCDACTPTVENVRPARPQLSKKKHRSPREGRAVLVM